MATITSINFIPSGYKQPHFLTSLNFSLKCNLSGASFAPDNANIKILYSIESPTSSNIKEYNYGKVEPNIAPTKTMISFDLKLPSEFVTDIRFIRGFFIDIYRKRLIGDIVTEVSETIYLDSDKFKLDGNTFSKNYLKTQSTYSQNIKNFRVYGLDQQKTQEYLGYIAPNFKCSWDDFTSTTILGYSVPIVGYRIYITNLTNNGYINSLFHIKEDNKYGSSILIKNETEYSSMLYDYNYYYSYLSSELISISDEVLFEIRPIANTETDWDEKYNEENMTNYTLVGPENIQFSFEILQQVHVFDDFFPDGEIQLKAKFNDVEQQNLTIEGCWGSKDTVQLPEDFDYTGLVEEETNTLKQAVFINSEGSQKYTFLFENKFKNFYSQENVDFNTEGADKKDIFLALKIADVFGREYILSNILIEDFFQIAERPRWNSNINNLEIKVIGTDKETQINFSPFSPINFIINPGETLNCTFIDDSQNEIEPLVTPKYWYKDGPMIGSVPAYINIDIAYSKEPIIDLNEIEFTKQIQISSSATFDITYDVINKDGNNETIFCYLRLQGMVYPIYYFRQLNYYYCYSDFRSLMNFNNAEEQNHLLQCGRITTPELNYCTLSSEKLIYRFNSNGGDYNTDHRYSWFYDRNYDSVYETSITNLCRTGQEKMFLYLYYDENNYITIPLYVNENLSLKELRKCFLEDIDITIPLNNILTSDDKQNIPNVHTITGRYYYSTSFPQENNNQEEVTSLSLEDGNGYLEFTLTSTDFSIISSRPTVSYRKNGLIINGTTNQQLPNEEFLEINALGQSKTIVINFIDESTYLPLGRTETINNKDTFIPAMGKIYYNPSDGRIHMGGIIVDIEI